MKTSVNSELCKSFQKLIVDFFLLGKIMWFICWLSVYGLQYFSPKNLEFL